MGNTGLLLIIIVGTPQLSIPQDLMSSLYACIPAYGRVFIDSGPLTTHQRHCRIWHANQLKVRRRYREAEARRSKTAREKLQLSRVTVVSTLSIPCHPALSASAIAGTRTTHAGW